jgi:hypothetical protein
MEPSNHFLLEPLHQMVQLGRKSYCSNGTLISDYLIQITLLGIPIFSTLTMKYTKMKRISFKNVCI